ncbi:MAG: CBS domain-containing protein [Coriobacteriia bacterium]|nr:CBS domain-containing protein [Coriobacteriia bacterium]
MNYLSQMIGLPVYDAIGEKIGEVNDLGIATGEIFPRVTSLAFKGPSKTPFMISWRKYVDNISDEGVYLAVGSKDIRFSYLQPSELLLARDLLDKQIVDTQGLKVVRVNDLKISQSGKNQLRLLGAETGSRGILRQIWPPLEDFAIKIAGLFGKKLNERLIAWNYMDLLDRDLSQVKLSITHKRLDELHPADVADIIEQLDPKLRASVFASLDEEVQSATMSELEDEYQADVIDDMDESSASVMISNMDPDDAADILNELDYDKAEKLLRLMGVNEQQAIRSLLGFKDETAGGIMTSEFVALDENSTVSDTVDFIRSLDEDHETINYVYTLDKDGVLSGVLSLRTLVLAQAQDLLVDLAHTDLITASPEEDQEEVAEAIMKYDLLAMPVVDENFRLLGIVTVDDALDVMQEEHEEDLQLAGANRSINEGDTVINNIIWFIRRQMWFFIWLALAVVFFAIGLGEKAPYLLLGLPLILIIADDMTSYASNYAIEYAGSEDAPSVWKSLGRNFSIGMSVAGILGLISLVAISFINVGTINEELSLLSMAGGLTIFIIIFLSAFFMYITKWRADRGKEPVSYFMSFVAMVLSSLIYLSIAFVFEQSIYTLV